MNKSKGGIREKTFPERRCVGCREMKNKTELVRIVKKADDSGFALDATGKAPGRGAYVCKDAECLRKAAKSKGFDRSFKQKVSAEVYVQLEEMLGEL